MSKHSELLLEMSFLDINNQNKLILFWSESGLEGWMYAL